MRQSHSKTISIWLLYVNQVYLLNKLIIWAHLIVRRSKYEQIDFEGHSRGIQVYKQELIDLPLDVIVAKISQDEGLNCLT